MKLQLRLALHYETHLLGWKLQCEYNAVRWNWESDTGQCRSLNLASLVVTWQPPSWTFSNSTFCPHSVCIDMFYVDLRTKSHYFPIQHWLTGFYNRDGVCLLRGTDWVFKCNSGWPCSLTGFKLLMKMVGLLSGGDQTSCHLLVNKTLL